MLGGSCSLSWVGEAKPCRLDGRLGSRADLELAQDRADVMIDRVLGEHEPFRNLGLL